MEIWLELRETDGQNVGNLPERCSALRTVLEPTDEPSPPGTVPRPFLVNFEIPVLKPNRNSSVQDQPTTTAVAGGAAASRRDIIGGLRSAIEPPTV